MNDQEEFLWGFIAGSGCESASDLARAYREWLKREGYDEIHRIDLESGGYDAGLEVGRLWRETN